tara:strand:+ start:1901 stop:2353 length:453 start_codon:yes stop_codon:yes gene_type:complete
MKIQIIGLPATGKTTFIKKYIKNNPKLNIKHLDIAEYKEKYPKKYEKIFKKHIEESNNNLIAESADGRYIAETTTIKYKLPYDIVSNRKRKRDMQCDDWYMNQLETIQIPAHYTAHSEQALEIIFDKLFGKDSNDSKIRTDRLTRSQRRN